MTPTPDRPPPPIRVAYVDVLVFRGAGDFLELLCLRRGPLGRSPGSWEAVHAHIEEGETPVETALRELAEETGLPAERLYNLSRVEQFYRHTTGEIMLAPVFAARVSETAEARTSPEHDACEWLPPEAAKARVTWPRIRREITDLVRLLGRGDAGAIEDVLRIK